MKLGLSILLFFIVFFYFSVEGAPNRIDLIMKGRMESNCFFSPLGCVFFPNNYPRVRRLLQPTQQLYNQF